jgi:hypothetical protein
MNKKTLVIVSISLLSFIFVSYVSLVASAQIGNMEVTDNMVPAQTIDPVREIIKGMATTTISSDDQVKLKMQLDSNTSILRELRVMNNTLNRIELKLK